MRSPGGRQLTAFVAALALTIAAPASASAGTFGANLNNAPNSTTTCGEGVFPYFSAPMGSPSCLYFSGSAAASPYAPASGTITAIHVRVGAVTGPMQVVIMRSLYQNKAGDPGHPYFACCFIERYGPVFTPQANTITTVPANLPVTEEPTPPPEDFSTNAAGDFLALSVLAQNVPIPAATDAQSTYSGFYPAPTEAAVAAPSPNPLFAATDGSGAEVLISGDLEGGGGGVGGGGVGGGGGPAPAPAPVAAPRLPAIGLPKTTIPVKGNTATVPLQCLVVDCVGTLALQNAKLAGLASVAKSKARAKAPKVLSYGTAHFSIKAGKTAKIKVSLNSTGRRLLKGRRSAKVWANVRFSSGGGASKSIKVTLKR